MVIHHMLAMGAGFLLSSANLQTANPPALTGIWESERCVIQERAGTRTSSRSTFVFLDDEWALELIQYSDAACTTPSLRAFFQGRYRVIRPSTVVQGAYDADFGFTRKRLTLYADALLAEANRGACGERTWTRGREEDVSATGCLWVVPVSACTQEFDLVKVDDDRLLLGERPPAGQDLCRADRRARALRSLPLVRRLEGLTPDSVTDVRRWRARPGRTCGNRDESARPECCESGPQEAGRYRDCESSDIHHHRVAGRVLVE